MIYYFSGTGNSLYVAQHLADALGEKLCPMTSPVPTDDSVIGLVFPVYAWGIPNVVERFVRKHRASCLGGNADNGCYLYAVMTCGDDMGYADKVLEKELGREVSVNEIADRIGESAENVVMAMDAVCPAESLYKSVHQGDRGDIYLIDKLATDDGGEDGMINRIALRQLIGKLCDRDRQIILLRYFKGKTQREISDVLGISQVQVSRIEKKILSELRIKLKGA